MNDIEKSLWNLFDNMDKLKLRDVKLLKNSIETILPNEQLMLDAVKIYIKYREQGTE